MLAMAHDGDFKVAALSQNTHGEEKGEQRHRLSNLTH